MDITERSRWARRPLATVLILALVAVLAMLLGHFALALVLGGALLIGLAAWFGDPLVARVTSEHDAGRVLVWDLLLVGVVLLALIGIGMMAAPLR
ncbi:MAG: hypothetical protein WBV06_17160 [Acidimicrobiia bacterium]